MSFRDELACRVERVEEILKSMLPEESGYQKQVLEAMNYSMLAGGKRLRPLMMREVFDCLDGQGKEIDYFQTALEMIHNYSLVHDDMPCMDNDMYRRGRKTTHAVYGEGMALLAGDGLLNLAMETAAKAFEVTDNPERVGRAISILFRKSGVYGMMGGQCADLLAESLDKDKVTGDLLIFIHEHKTAALIEAALMIGAVLAGADDDTVAKLERIGSNVGQAFQIQDDVLDVESTFEELGKPIGSDIENDKLTYVSLYGLEESKRLVADKSKEAIDLLDSIDGNTEFLKLLFESLITRRS